MLYTVVPFPWRVTYMSALPVRLPQLIPSFAQTLIRFKHGSNPYLAYNGNHFTILWSVCTGLKSVHIYRQQVNFLSTSTRNRSISCPEIIAAENCSQLKYWNKNGPKPTLFICSSLLKMAFVSVWLFLLTLMLKTKMELPMHGICRSFLIHAIPLSSWYTRIPPDISF